MPIHKIFFYLFLLFLPTQLGRHWWPEWSFVWGLRVDYLAPTVYLSDILLLLTLSAWLLTLIPNLKFSYTKTHHDRYVKSYSKIASIGVILGVILFFNFQKVGFGELWFCKFVKLVELVLLAFYVTKTTKTKTDFKRIVNFLLIGAVFESGLAIAQFLKQGSIGGLFWWFGERTFNITTPGIARIALRNPFTGSQTLFLRPYGTFSHPNSLAGYLLVILILAGLDLHRFSVATIRKQILKLFSGDARINTNYLKKTFHLLFIPLFLIPALLLTCSRSAWLVGILLLVLWNLSNLEKRKKIFSLVLLLLSTIYYLLSIIYTSTDPESFQKRWELTLASWEMIKSSPLFGIGLGHFIPKLAEFPQKGQIFWLQPVHNIFLLVMTESGLVGLAVFLGVLGTTYKRLVSSIWYLVFRGKKKKILKERYILYTTYYILLSLSAILLTGLFDHYWLTLQQNQLLFALILGLSWVRPKLKEKI